MIIDTDRFRDVPDDGDLDGGVDAAVVDAFMADAPIYFDANPQALAIDSVEPASLVEGVGSSAVGPGALVVLSGSNIIEGATVRVEGDDAIVVGTPVIAMDHASLAVELRLPVDAELGDGDQKTITLVVEQAGISASEDVTIVGLDELAPEPGGTLQVAGLKPRYSRIVFSGGTFTLRGDGPARFVATGDITVETSAVVDASGGLGADPGPGGCAGGAPRTTGQCGAGGGGAGPDGMSLGSNGEGGGGGGASEQGANAGGDGGAKVDVALIAVLGGASGARGHGGGGGGQGILLVGGLGGAGGTGGAGGGGLELTAGGRLTLGGTVKASGGGGSSGGGGCGSGGGGGGGGGGGALLLRAAGEVKTEGSPVINAQGGKGATTCTAGGDGAPGWIRVDSPTGIPGSDPVAARGPMWSVDQPIVQDPSPTLQLVGGSNQAYAVSVNGGVQQSVTTDGSGRAEVDVDLELGLNEICAFVLPNLSNPQPEARNCVTIVYLR